MIMKENILINKSFNFAVRIIKLYKYLSENNKEYILSKQLLRSGTSIWANIQESQDAQSKKDFLSKLSISLKESKETLYWLKLLKDTEYIKTNEFDSINKDLLEIIKLFTSIIKTTKQNLK